MQAVVDSLHMAHGWLSTQTEALLGLSIPIVVVLGIPFVIVLIVAVAMREWLSILWVAGLAWLGVSALTSSFMSLEGALQFGAAWIMALAVVLVARSQRRGREKLAEILTKSEADLADASTAVDRERLWRRAGGDPRSIIGGDDIAVLIERLDTSSKRAAIPGNGLATLDGRGQRSQSA